VSFRQRPVLDDVGGTTILTVPGRTSFTASGSFDCATLGGCSAMQLDVFFTTLGETDGVSSIGTFTP
jgi:hypothetical protein